MKIIFLPYNLLGIMGLILLILSFFFIKKSANIHLSDTYYIIPLTHILQVFAALLFFFFIVYRLTGYFLFSNWLTWVHISVTLISVIVIVVNPFLSNSLNNSKPSNSNWKEWVNVVSYDRVNQMMVIASLGLIIVQLTYIVNFAAGLIKRFH
jgi:hypothetical protein